MFCSASDAFPIVVDTTGLRFFLGAKFRNIWGQSPEDAKTMGKAISENVAKKVPMDIPIVNVMESFNDT